MRTRLVPVFLLATALLLSLESIDPRAERLPVLARPTHYDLAFDVELGAARFDGVETIDVQLDQPTTRIVLNALDITFHEVTIRAGGGQPQTARVTLDSDAQTATLTVPRTLPAGPAQLHLTFAGVLSKELRGFYLSNASGRTYAVTQFESSDARRAFPCFDDPSLKATFGLRLTIDRGDTAISNGALVSDTPGPGPSRHTLTFAVSPKMSSYLVAMAVGDFQCLEDSAENIPIRICATPNKKELGHIALDWAKQILSFYNAYFSIRYPFGKIDMVAIPDFAAGGMENTGAIFYREADLLADSSTASAATRKNIASILAHEMSHQWFGDLVTMRWWDDLWLNEGFATWMANRPLAAAKPEWNIAVDEADETRTALNLDGLKATRPIRSSVETPDQIEESFDAIAYEKGGAVMRMVEGYLGPDVFRKGINAYLERYAYGNATSENFWTVMASVSGKPVDRILPTFVNQPGAPVVDVSLNCRNGRTELSLRQSRFVLESGIAGTRPRSGATGAGPIADSNELWQIPVCVKSGAQSNGACQVLARAAETVTIGNGCQSWAFINAGARGYFRAAYSPEMLRAMAPEVATALTPAERARLADDEWALVSAGRHGVADFLTLAGGFGNERAPALLAQIVSRLEFIHDNVVTDATRTDFARWVRTLLSALYADLGIAAGDGETDDRHALRAVVVGALGNLGDDPAVLAAARATLDRLLAAAPSAGNRLDSTTASAIIRVAARHGDRELYDALLSAADRASAPEDHYRYLYALTAFEDPQLTDRALEYSLSTEIRRQDAPLYLARFLANPAVNARAWEFMKQRWPDLQSKLTASFGEVRIIEALGSFCSPAARDDVKEFFAAHKPGAATRALDQAVERMNNCITLREKQAPLLAAWLQGQR